MRGFLKVAAGLAVLVLTACGGPTKDVSDATMMPGPSTGEVQAEAFDMCLPDGSCPKEGQVCLENRRCVDCTRFPVYCR